jgi:uncharacterized protein YggE
MQLNDNFIFRNGTCLVLILIITMICFPMAGTAAENDQVATAELATEGTVQVKPDKATFNFSVVTEAPQAQEAAKANAKEAENFLTAIKRVLGKDDKVKTLQYQVLPIFRRVEKTQGKRKINTDEIAGYRASHRFEVELRDLEKIGQVADTAVKNGANEVQGPYFGHTQQEDLQNQAAVKALERARKLAEALAQASGLKVKRVLRMSTTQTIQPRMFAMAKAAPPAGAEVTTPIEVGDITYRSHLTVSFELAP